MSDVQAARKHGGARVMARDGYSYIGRKPCGCMVAAIVDEPDMAKIIAEWLPKWIAQGLTIEHVHHDVVRSEFVTNCPHPDMPKGQLALLLEVEVD